MKIAISAESTHDLGKDLVEKNGVCFIPYNIVLGDKIFKDGEISTEEIFTYVDQNGTLPKTNAINEYEYTEYFEQLRKEYDAVVHVCLSSGLSSSCSNAIRAGKNVSNVYVVDSLNLSTGIGLLVMYACQLRDKGVDAKTIYEMLESRKEKVQASFVIERLDYLYKGGRCNSLQLFGANLLRLRPRIVVKDGKMSADKKYRGNMEKVVSKYCQETLDEFDTPSLDMVFITYSSATPEMVKSAREALEYRGFKNIYETTAGCTISSHCGGNTLGILYFNDGEAQN